MADGKGVSEVPPAVYEAVFAFVYGWDLETIRNMSVMDFTTHAPLVDYLFKRKLVSALG